MSSDAASPVVTRIAPSPTGTMHIGTARTGLFNWLFARKHGGKFVLRIEDTDRERSTPEATQAILDGMAWLGLDYDGEAVSQFARADRHREVAEQMLAEGHAYKCFSTQDEIAAFRDAAKADGRSTLFLSPWREASDHPDAPYVIRLKAPRDGTTVIRDRVQSDVTIQNATLDDMILLRSDGTPTYMHAVVVDDHDMGVTHVVRGDDHLNNAARQIQIYAAMGWAEPVWSHIPLIHGDDGKKLSKRHGATGVMEYAEMGIPAAAMRNYLTRLGWSHGDEELFTDEQARDWFDLDGIGKSPSRLDMKKLANVTGWHIARTDDADLVAQIEGYLALTGAPALSQAQHDGLTRAMYCLKDRAKSLPDLLDKGRFVLENRPFDYDEKSVTMLDPVSRSILRELTAQLQNARWTRDTLEGVLNAAADSHGLKFGKLAGPLRAALSGRSVSPSVFDMMLVIGRDETLARLDEAASLT
ncbi:glutamate--tRNA ligase [Jannaschia sp. CCS1]|uniref:Glutamate--tRNA ligase 1 n=1 Tax=Jannaschia sp. (strain CCS1) TaxID=290400 RepID=SYE1_JANSC|nr:glutamate--tRNA ligase [Jannaschia sp. CCS1]Q28RA3.1 RecName: Full=Glutamate--tRNA ligase 1; AltName: Full=Glutamyl-tRNA synthetase 1; Short=GluRS 1 [Jannaschia sp. CCS1]ABD54759.1 glutamyl-tRNA synthetase [Jannaschia sp. CCS1]